MQPDYICPETYYCMGRGPFRDTNPAFTLGTRLKHIDIIQVVQVSHACWHGRRQLITHDHVSSFLTDEYFRSTYLCLCCNRVLTGRVSRGRRESVEQMRFRGFDWQSAASSNALNYSPDYYYALKSMASHTHLLWLKSLSRRSVICMSTQGVGGNGEVKWFQPCREWMSHLTPPKSSPLVNWLGYVGSTTSAHTQTLITWLLLSFVIVVAFFLCRKNTKINAVWFSYQQVRHLARCLFRFCILIVLVTERQT